jgi:DNA-binding beta-propeller fold protein YncE
MYVIGACYSLFVDIYGNLYCTISDSHIVVKKLFGDDANTTQIVAGNGSAGSAPNMLNIPRGIFVDLDLNLYVADCDNDRIQLFPPDQLNATTIIGNGSSGITTISLPMAIMIDVDGYFFILEYQNSRIVRVGPNSFTCIAACTGTNGSAANQLNYPWNFAFDSYGNIFVADRFNSRIQKFLLINNSCGKF